MAAFSDEFGTGTPLPHAWACKSCGFHWTHHGAYLAGPRVSPEAPTPPAGESDEEPRGLSECANCGQALAYLVDCAGPTDAAFHYECHGCEKHYFLADVADVVPEADDEETDDEAEAVHTEKAHPYWCAECQKMAAQSEEYQAGKPLPHNWACSNCHFRWSHNAEYYNTRPPMGDEPLRTWPCPACGMDITEVTNPTAPHGEPRHWRCKSCTHEFTVSDGWE
jgi:transposase-like protein